MTSSPVQRSNEEPLFLPIGDEYAFAVLHMPNARPTCAVVVCHALAEEKLWSHRVYVTFARELAARGGGVLRLDFRGEGESDREFEETNVVTRVEDVCAAVDELRRRVGISTPLILLGHRIGGSVAAAAVHAGCDVAGVVIWDAILDGSEYLLQLLRSNLTTQIAAEGKVTRTRDMLTHDIQQGRPVVVDGYGLTRELFEGLRTLDWVRNWRSPPKGALVLEVARGDAPQLSKSLRELVEREPNVRCAVVSEQPFWRETRQFHRCAPNFTARTFEWLADLK